MTEYVMQAEDVAIHYGGVKAVDGVALTLIKGQIRGLIGPNGAGKTTVINAITQERYGTDRRHADYPAIRKAMRQVSATAKMTQDEEAARAVLGLVDAVAMPLIGAGLAGGSWAVISRIIEEEATHFQPVVYLIDGIVPAFDSTL